MYLFTPSLQTSFLCRSPECDKQSSLCSKVCSHWLSILQTVSIVSIYQSQSPGSFHPPCPIYISVSISALQIGLSIPFSFPRGSVVKNSPANVDVTASVPGLGRSLEEEIRTHSSILAWEIPWTEEPGRLQSMGL